MTGTLITSENAAASPRSSPQNTPAASVVPLRESPGMTASACAHPMPSARGAFRRRGA